MVIFDAAMMLAYSLLDYNPGELKQNFFDFIVFFEAHLLQMAGLIFH
jgi:hypothetical protein